MNDQRPPDCGQSCNQCSSWNMTSGVPFYVIWCCLDLGCGLGRLTPVADFEIKRRTERRQAFR